MARFDWAQGIADHPRAQWRLSGDGRRHRVGDTVTYTIAFGDSDPLLFATTTALTSYTPTLVTDTTYYWVITATDGISTVVGPTWRFSTAGFEYIYLPLVLRSH